MYHLQLTQAELIQLLTLVNAKINNQANFGQAPNATIISLANKLKGLTK